MWQDLEYVDSESVFNSSNKRSNKRSVDFKVKFKQVLYEK